MSAAHSFPCFLVTAGGFTIRQVSLGASLDTRTKHRSQACQSVLHKPLATVTVQGLAWDQIRAPEIDRLLRGHPGRRTPLFPTRPETQEGKD